MRKINTLTVDDAARACFGLIGKYKAAVISTVLCGLAAHMYMLTNKLINCDEAASVYSKGATIGSGRWALEWTEFLFPNYSMPWLYGLLSILFIAAAVCLTISIFEIKSPVFQALLGAAAVTSPVVTATLCFMFTSAPYCFAIALAVLAVFLVVRGGRLNYVLGCLCLCVSLGYYQAYISVSASLFVVLLLKKLLCDKKDAAFVLRLGIKYFISLAASLALYGAVTLISLRISQIELIGYGYTSLSLPRALLNCYTNIIRTLFFSVAALVPNAASSVAHVVCLICGAFGAISLLRGRKSADIALAAVLLVLLPVAINCLYFAASVDIIHTIVKAGYVSVYVLCIVMVQALDDKKRLISWGLALSMLLITAVNISYDNACYLKMHLQYENAFAFYSGVAKDVRECEGYDESCSLIPIGDTADWMTPQYGELYTYDNVGVSENLVDGYTRGSFLRYYTGLDMPTADWEAIYAYDDDPRVAEMPCYPQKGYVQRIDDYIVVKFGQKP